MKIDNRWMMRFIFAATMLLMVTTVSAAEFTYYPRYPGEGLRNGQMLCLG